MFDSALVDFTDRRSDEPLAGPPALQPLVAKVAALIDERAPLDELDRAWAVLLRLWNAVDRSAPQSTPAGEPGAA
jgi:hypothetical protein